MDKSEIKIRRRVLAKGNKNYTKALTEIPKEKWPSDWKTLPLAPIEMYRSSEFMVNVYQENNCLRMTVNRTSINSKGEWNDGIPWETLQSIKTEIGFGDKDAIEIYPNDKDVVNVANMRHLWIMPTPIGCAWRNKIIQPSDDPNFAKIEVVDDEPENLIPMGKYAIRAREDEDLLDINKP